MSQFYGDGQPVSSATNIRCGKRMSIVDVLADISMKYQQKIDEGKETKENAEVLKESINDAGITFKKSFSENILKRIHPCAQRV